MAINYDDLIDREARTEDVDPRLMKTILTMESSGGRNNVASLPNDPDSPIGPAQMRPSTGRTVGITDVTNPEQAVRGMARYLRQGLDATGTPQGALAHYFAGPDTSGWGPKTAAYVAKGTALYPTMTVQPGQSGDTAIRGAVNRARGGQAPSSEVDPDVAAGMDVLNAARTGAPSPTQQAAPAAKAGPVDPDVAAGLDALKTAREYKLKPTKPAGPDLPMTTDPYGTPWVGEGAPPNSPAMDRIVDAGVQGWRGSEPIVTPKGEDAINALGPVGRFIVNPALKIAGTGLAAGNALGSALMQTGTEIGTATGHPELGRDINMLAQVAPAAGAFLEGGSVAAGRAGMEVSAAPRSQGPRVSPESFGPFEHGPPAPAMIPPDAPLPPPNALRPEPPAFVPPSATAKLEVPPSPAGGPSPGMGGPQPQSAGAAATPRGAAGFTNEEAARARTVADKEWFNTSQQPGVPDTTIHVPGIIPTLVEQEQSVVRARELKALRNQNAEVSQSERELLDANSEKRKRFYNETAGSDVIRGADLKAAGEKIEQDLGRVWKGKGEADPAGVQTQIAAELEGSAGHLPPLKSAMQQVSESLEKAGTDPETMYRTRRLINFLQSREGHKANPGYGDADVQAALTRTKKALDAAIEPAAPGFGKAMSDYATVRGPLDAAKELQGRELTLYDNKGRMSFPAVHSLVRDIIKAQEWDAPDHALRFVSEEQFNRLRALHDDLKRVASAHDLEAARGSDSAQNFMDVVKGVGKTGAAMGAHAAANAVAPVAGSFVVNALGGALERGSARRQVKRQKARAEEILRPEPPPNALQPPD